MTDRLTHSALSQEQFQRWQSIADRLKSELLQVVLMRIALAPSRENLTQAAAEARHIASTLKGEKAETLNQMADEMDASLGPR